ncbi:MAG TPA: acetylxylan esterase [Candidatus Hydrogenedentes bacterium]|nr:acetylxylan esterase [Candidatus Hydrogenedentota bacterium]HPG69241.1 acetylxylan esterase [Candidatus Hydrogenedentota bacterium]
MTAAMLIIMSALKLSWDVHYFDEYYPDAPLNYTFRSEEMRPDYHRIEFTFEGVPGHPVPAVLAKPKGQEGPFPALIFLHGIGQNKKFLDEIAAPFVKENYIIVSFDQLMQGERDLSEENYLAQGLAFRNRAAYTVIETRRLITLLEQRQDVIPDRIFLLGASYGAITGSTVAAFDHRLRGVCLCYGGGDIRKLVDSVEAQKIIGPAMPLAQAIAAWYMGPADPVRYVRKISPTPVLFQNGRYDSIVPPASSEALIAAAREPKDVIWYESDHVGLDREHVVTVLNDALEWIKAHDKN